MAQPYPPAPRTQALTYDGRVGEIYGIFLLNILFTILTLGIWRFWAITRYRRYFWSRMSFAGERFEYTGTGGELFVGFLLAGLMLIGAAVITGLLSFALSFVSQVLAVVPVILLYGFVIVLGAGAVFSAQRYRLTRTLWSGIRGGMSGSVFGYGFRAVLYTLAALATAMQLLPWSRIRLAELRINASNFGSARFSFHGRAMHVYLAFLLTLIATVALFAVIATGVWSILRRMLAGGVNLDAALDAMSPAAAYVVFIGLALFSILSTLVSCWYVALFERHVVGNSALGPMRFSSSVTGVGLFGLVAGNMLIALFTLGLGFPFLLQRNAAFLARNLWCSGSLDLATLAQSTTGAPRFGEGMYQQLDGGGIL